VPWFVALYLAIFTILTGVALVAGWREAKAPRRELVLDALDNLGWIALAAAYWRADVQALLGLWAVPLFLICFIWFFKSMEPAVDWLRRHPKLDEGRVREIAWFGFTVNLIAVAPAMWWGLRVCIDAVNAMLAS
jgi:hypothetical protein